MRQIIDTRDLKKELDELEDELEGLQDNLAEAQEEAHECDSPKGEPCDCELCTAVIDCENELEEWLGENEERLNELRTLRDEIPEFEYGEALIADGYFEEYAQDLASDLYGNEIAGASWPFDCIDWERAADELKMDYSSIEFDGDTWWYRG